MNKKRSFQKKSESRQKRRRFKPRFFSKKSINIQQIAIILIILGIGIGCTNLFLLGPALSGIRFIPFPPPTPTSLPATSAPTSNPIASTPSAIIRTSTATPYVLIFEGFINCRAEPTTSSPSLIVIRGEQFIILARDQSGSWLLVSVKGIDRPCWINRNIPGLTIDDFSRIPVFPNATVPSTILPSSTPYPTYTLLPTYTPFPTLNSISTSENPSMAQWVFIYLPGCLASIGTIILGFLTLFSENFFSWWRSRLDTLRARAETGSGRYSLERAKIDSEISNAERRLALDERRVNAEVENEEAKLELEKLKLEFEKEKYKDELDLKNKNQKSNFE